MGRVLACAFFCTFDVLALHMNTSIGKSNEPAFAFGDLDDIVNGGPDWADEEEHWDDFLDNMKDYAATASEDVWKQSSNNVNLYKFIHVGKCGGSSIRAWLRRNNVSFHETHLARVHTCGENESTWLFSVRDPIDRAISSFNWRSPRTGNAEHGQQMFGSREREFYECFEYFNDFAEALDDQSTCGHYARRALNDPQGSEHLGKGVAWYLDEQLDCVLKQKVFVSHAESLASDLEAFGKCIGIDNLDMHIPHKNSYYPMQNQTYISSKAGKLLRKWLENDCRVLQELEHIAVNGKQKVEGSSK